MWRAVRTIEGRCWGLWAVVTGWIARRLGKCRSSAEERRLRAEAKVLRGRIVRLEGQLVLAEEDAAVEVRRLRAELAEAEAQVAARTAEVEAFQTAHENVMAMFGAHTAVLNACEAFGGMVAQPRRRT